MEVPNQVKFIWQAKLKLHTVIVGEEARRKEVRYKYIDKFFKQIGNADLPDKEKEMLEIVEGIKKKSGLFRINSWITILLAILGVLTVGLSLGLPSIGGEKYVAWVMMGGIALVLAAIKNCSRYSTYGEKSSTEIIRQYMEKNEKYWELNLVQLGYKLDWHLEEKTEKLTEYDQFRKKDVTYTGVYPYLELHFNPLGMEDKNHEPNNKQLENKDQGGYLNKVSPANNEREFNLPPPQEIQVIQNFTENPPVRNQPHQPMEMNPSYHQNMGVNQSYQPMEMNPSYHQSMRVNQPQVAINPLNIQINGGKALVVTKQMRIR